MRKIRRFMDEFEIVALRLLFFWWNCFATC